MPAPDTQYAVPPVKEKTMDTSFCDICTHPGHCTECKIFGSYAGFKPVHGKIIDRWFPKEATQ